MEEEKVPNPELNAEQSRVWEQNHKAIMACIRPYICANGRTPTSTYIAEQTGISRQTVRRHIRDFAMQPHYREHTGMFKYMTTDLLAHLYAQAIRGDVRATRLYMELVGVLKHNELVEDSFLNERPKLLQFDGVDLTQELFDDLGPVLQDKLSDAIRECLEELKEYKAQVNNEKPA
jgi:hypothetical protein